MNRLHPRVARSRENLIRALIALSQEQGYASLSIVDVTKRARVGYTTFYRHYKSLDELVVDIFESAIDEIVVRIRKQRTPYEEAVALWTYVKENVELYRFYIDLPGDHPVREAVFDKTAQIVMERYKPRDENRVPLDVAVKHLVESIYQLLRWYLAAFDDYTPEQIATIYHDLIVQGTESTALVSREDWNGLQAAEPA